MAKVAPHDRVQFLWGSQSLSGVVVFVTPGWCYIKTNAPVDGRGILGVRDNWVTDVLPQGSR